MKILLISLIISLCWITPAEAGAIKRLRNKVLITGAVVVGAAVVQSKVAKNWRCLKLKKQGLDGQTEGCSTGNPTSDESDTDDQDGVLLRNAAGIKELRRNLVSERTSQGYSNPDPGPGCEPHHIVPEEEGRPWAKQSADVARGSLRGCVGINDTENGIFLPVKDDSQGNPNCPGSNHKKVHNSRYYEEIGRKLSGARNFGCSAVKRALQSIKNELMNGKVY